MSKTENGSHIFIWSQPLKLMQLARDQAFSTYVFGEVFIVKPQDKLYYQYITFYSEYYTRIFVLEYLLSISISFLFL